MDGIILRHLSPLMKGKTLSREQRQFVVRGIYTEIAGSLKNQKDYQTKLNSLRKEGNPEKTSRYVGSKVAQIAEKLVKKVWAQSGFANAGAARRPGADKGAQNRSAGSGNARPVVVSKKPTPDKIDWSKDRSRMRFMSGEATLLPEFGGKVVKWDRDAL
jgi:hypothetical protein